MKTPRDFSHLIPKEKRDELRQRLNEPTKQKGSEIMVAEKINGKLVHAEKLLDELFAPECRPSLRWLRTQTKSKSIPHIRIGHLVFFDVEMVRAALAKAK